MKQHTKFSQTEITQLLITAVVAGFYLSFDNWGLQEVDYVVGLQNFLGATFVLFLIISTIVIAQKFLGFVFGYVITYEYSWAGLIVGFFLTTLTYGAVPFFLPGGIQYHLIKHKRIGLFSPSHNHMEMFTVASLSVAIPLLYTMVFGTIAVAADAEFFEFLALAALLVAAYSLIPAPHLKPLSKWHMHGPSDFSFLKKLQGGTYGYDLLSFGRIAYYLLVLFTIMFAGLVLLFQTFSIILAAIFSVLMITIYKLGINYVR